MSLRTAPAHAVRRDPASPSGTGFRPEIQGLRAVAVLLVVVFHLWPEQVSGGFVGVDVFFVISGYLITAHIYREAATTGTLKLRRFWARRIRRLLPASLLVLALSAVATVAFLPATLWGITARQIGASALYVQNWALAGDAVDYMAKDNVPTVAQHYWSLSVEEQFYLVWPVLVLGLVLLATAIARGRRAPAVRGFLIAGLSLVGAVSLAWSVIATQRDQATAYFVTPTRVWEFVAGGLIALVGVGGLRSQAVRGLLGWLGIAAILVAGFAFDGRSLFPGWIALLPVLGTVAVIVAGSTPGPATAAWWLSRRPATFVGDISYSVYLWHWPLIVVLPYVTGVELRLLDKLAILAATILLAWVSKVVVEDPMRTRPLLAAVPWRSFAFAATGMAVVVSGCVVITEEVDRRTEEALVAADESLMAAASGEACVGPAALDPANDCDPVEGTGALVPPPEVVVQQNSDPPWRGCQQTLEPTTVTTCELGSDNPDPDRVVALVGDSHATHWFAAFNRLGQDRNWKVITYVKTSCPVMTARRVLPDEQTTLGQDSCLAWGDDVRRQIADDDRISEVFTSAYSSAYEFAADPDDPLDDPRVDGFHEVWQDWTDSGKDVFVIKDIPRTQGGNVPNCLATNPDDRLACATTTAELPPDAIADAAASADDPRVHLVDLTDQFCDDTTCYPVVGDMIVYRDYSHLSAEYSEALVPYITEQVDAAQD